MLKVKQSNPGWLKKLLERYGNGAEIAIGLPKGSEGSGVSYPDGTSLLDVAYFNELGIGVPERSFLRAGVLSNMEDLNSLSAGLVEKINEGKINIETAGEALGQKGAAVVAQYINDLSDPPNAESTIKRKKSSNPLVNTKLLHQSITHAVRSKK
jgi:hypothetical protein